MYIDELLCVLRDSGSGCQIGPNYCGAFGYADDVVLLSPSVNAMKDMLNVCGRFADKHKVLFNAKKSNIVHFACKKNSKAYDRFSLFGEHINLVIANIVAGYMDVKHIMSAFNKSVNILMASLGGIPVNHLSSSVGLLQSYLSKQPGS